MADALIFSFDAEFFKDILTKISLKLVLGSVDPYACYAQTFGSIHKITHDQ